MCAAVLAEAYRYASMSALGITHCAVRDTCVSDGQGGTYPIPANTPVIINLYSAHYDPTAFANPHTFDPSRFLDEEASGGRLRTHVVDALMPYGLGARRCAGEYVARKEIFAFVVGILHECRVRPPDGKVRA